MFQECKIKISVTSFLMKCVMLVFLLLKAVKRETEKCTSGKKSPVIKILIFAENVKICIRVIFMSMCTLIAPYIIFEFLVES